MDIKDRVRVIKDSKNVHTGLSGEVVEKAENSRGEIVVVKFEDGSTQWFPVEVLEPDA